MISEQPKCDPSFQFYELLIVAWRFHHIKAVQKLRDHRLKLGGRSQADSDNNNFFFFTTTTTTTNDDDNNDNNNNNSKMKKSHSGFKYQKYLFNFKSQCVTFGNGQAYCKQFQD